MAAVPKRYNAWLLFVLVVVCAINYADRSVVAAVAEPLRRDLKLTDFRIGLLQGLSFALLYSVLAVPFARLAERHSRVKIIAAATFVWSLASTLCGAAASFVQLLLLRVGVGVGEAGFMAPASSLLGDHFRRDQRAFATSIMMLGVPIGALIGAISGGIISQSLGWRWAFVIMGLPGVLIAALVVATLKEPPRGQIDGEQSVEVSSMGRVARLSLANPLFRHVVIGGTLAGFGLHGLGQFLGVYFVRVHSLPYGKAGVIYGLTTFATVGGGLLIGGYLSDRLGRANLRWYSLIPAIGMFLSAPLYAIAFQMHTLSSAIVFLLAAGICLLFHYGASVATVQNLATAGTRASMVALYQLIVTAIAVGFGPPLIGFLSDLFAARLGCPPGALNCAAAQATGLRYALTASTVLYAWGGVHYLLAARYQGRA